VIEAEGVERWASRALRRGELRAAEAASAFILSVDDEELAEGNGDQNHRRLASPARSRRNGHSDLPTARPHDKHCRTRCCANCTASSTCSRTRRSSSRAISREARAYLDTLAPPFFRALVHYAQDGSYSWHCPGHSGGVAFLKSPVGQMFHQFFGENMLRADVCNSVDELGQLLDHTGPVAASERNAARIFGAEHLFFVTNGTSTSNKIVWHYVVAPGDVVIVDRNCHKSVLHAITMTGAIPVFLTPTRNTRHHRPDPLEEFAPEHPEDRGQPVRAPGREQEAAHPVDHAEHLRRHCLQRRDAEADAERQHRDAALRRGLAAARGVPRLLPRHARDRQAAAQPDAIIFARTRRTSCSPACRRRRRSSSRSPRPESSTATSSTRRT
jgi:hypothetical protein